MLLDDMADFLTSGGAVSSGYVFTGRAPDQPDAVVVLYETGGFAPERIMTSAGRRGFRIRRSRTPKTNAFSRKRAPAETAAASSAAVRSARSRVQRAKASSCAFRGRAGNSGAGT